MLLLAAVVVGTAIACGVPSVDPPDLMRNGDDVASVPLDATTSNLSTCAQLCCATPGCVAFSYNWPQPEHTCVGASCCQINAHCCMLKNGPGTMTTNPWPGAITTGLVTPNPGPTPPFPWSPLISNVTLGPVSWWSGSGDTWPSAWAANNATYAWACDNGLGSPMSLYRLDGSPALGKVTPTLVGAPQPLNYSVLCAELGPTGMFPKINIKPAGMAAFGDGTLRVGVSCMNYGDDATFNRQHNLGGFIAVSADYGVTWTNASAVGGVLTGKFAAPVFVSCGRANAPCDALDGGYVYIYFPGSFDDAAYWDNNDGYWLARAASPKAAEAPGTYEFYAGLDGAGAPVWVTDVLQAQPVLVYGRMLGENAVSYSPVLQRYLMANFGFIDPAGNPRPWHTEPYQTPHRTQLIFLESPTPWGPWTMFYRSDDSPPAPGLYTPTFPSAWMDPACVDTGAGGQICTLGLAWACLDGAPNCRYTLNYQTVTLATNANVK